MKKLLFTIMASFAGVLLSGCATQMANNESSRQRTAYVVPAGATPNSQELGFYWPLSPTIEP